jgi:hypothetical protein
MGGTLFSTMPKFDLHLFQHSTNVIPYSRRPRFVNGRNNGLDSPIPGAAVDVRARPGEISSLNEAKAVAPSLPIWPDQT